MSVLFPSSWYRVATEQYCETVKRYSSVHAEQKKSMHIHVVIHSFNTDRSLPDISHLVLHIIDGYCRSSC